MKNILPIIFSVFATVFVIFFYKIIVSHPLLLTIVLTVVISTILWEVSIIEEIRVDKMKKETAKAILEDIEKRLNLLVNLNELEYMEVFVDKTKEFMTDEVVQGKIEALKWISDNIKKQFGVK